MLLPGGGSVKLDRLVDPRPGVVDGVVEVKEEPLGVDGEMGGLPSAGTDAAFVVGI